MNIERRIKDLVPSHFKHVYYKWRRNQSISDTISAGVLLDLLEDMKKRSAPDYFDDMTPLYEEASDLPSQVAEIEINDHCNLDCAMCRTSKATRAKGYMDLGMFEDIVASLFEHGMRNTNLHTIGDPLANKNLDKYLAVLRKYKFTISNLSTNCILLDKHIDTIFEYRDVIYNFRPSIDAASRDVYGKIRGGDWDKLHENLIQFVDRNSNGKDPFPIYVNNIITADNYHEIAYIPYIFSYLGPAQNFGFGVLDSNAPENSYFFTHRYFEEYIHQAPCRRLWSLYILKEGTLSACCRDYNGDLSHGNVLTARLSELYNGEEIKAMRRSHIEKDIEAMPEMCKTCYRIDPRIQEFYQKIIWHFYLNIGKHPVYLQDALNKIGPMINKKDFDSVRPIVMNM